MKTIVITGAGSGIGRATAIELSKQPEVRLILVGRTVHTLKETKEACQNKDSHIPAALDICEKDAWRTLFSQFDIPSIYAIFANAGVGGVNVYDEDNKWDEILRVNLTGTYTTIMECLPRLKAHHSPFKHIVMTSSCLARFGVPDQPAYCAAKTGLLGLTKSLALKFASDRILVNAICPGWVETEMAVETISRLGAAQGIDYEASLEQQKSFVPLQRISKPSDIAHFISFLFSEQQTSITGQGLDINNGSFML
ncbi:MAG: SDR family NAD(P)-dependent oxidoreductase [Flavobacteriales bacterium]